MVNNWRQVALRDWKLKPYDSKCINTLQEGLGISAILAELLYKRGIDSLDKARYFSCAGIEELVDSMEMSGMQDAITRIKAAIDMKQKVMIYGDYDVDGVCSIVLFLKAFETLGYPADYYIPDRFKDGYGVSMAAIEEIAARGYGLIITVDCGISSVREIEYANSIGLDVIVTDHHNPHSILPAAKAIVNPRLDENERLRDLSGAGVAFKVVHELLANVNEALLLSMLELVALATVADVMQLTGENRIMVKMGLKSLQNSSWPGIRALKAVSGLTGKTINVRDIGFMLAPRLNAAGRMLHAKMAVELLLSSEEQAIHRARELDNINELRKQTEEEIFQEIIASIKEDEISEQEVLVLDGMDWHHGVFGITAARLMKIFNKPVLLVTWTGDEGRGTARSKPGYDIYEGLNSCSVYLMRFGGHKLAAGFTIEKDHFQAFKSAIHNWGLLRKEQLKEVDDTSEYIDIDLDSDQINEQMINDIGSLEPFGEGNPEPLFLLRRVEIINPRLIGKELEHFKCQVNPDIEGVAFYKPEFLDLADGRCLIDLVGNVQENVFRGQKSNQIRIADMRLSYQQEVKKLLKAAGKLENCEGIVQKSAKSSAIIIYPTVRLLKKHRRIIEGFVHYDRIFELHGLLGNYDREAILAKIASASDGIFMCTQSIWNTYLSKKEADFADRGIECMLYEDLFRGLTTDSFIKYELNAKFGGSGHKMVFVNRLSTLDNLRSKCPQALVDAAKSNLASSKALQREFWHADSAIMLTDGGFCRMGSWYSKRDIDIFLADSPYSELEINMMMDPILHDSPRIIKISFAKESLDFNRRFLSNQSIDVFDLEILLIELAKMARPRMEALAWKSRFSDILGRKLNNLESDNILRCLDCIDLCQIAKKGSIIEIKVLSKLNLAEDTGYKLFFQEIEAERAAFNSFENKLINSLQW